MKPIRLFFMLSALAALYSCSDDSETEYRDYLVAHPLTMTLEEFASGPQVIAPQPMEQSGKIYVYGDYIFVNEPYKGVHVVDNRNPSAPEKVRFIAIPGNVDISVKDNYLFADSMGDLVALDISDMNNIRPVARLEAVLQENIVWPFEAEIIESDQWDPATEILIGWEVTTERLPVQEANPRMWTNDVMLMEAAAAADSGTGQGGSMARFKIVGDYLYAVDSHTINVFDISNLEAPAALEDVFAGFDIETIFNQGNHLFLGSMRGMYIYDISSPATPAFVSEFQHGTACDPVVVDGDYAFVTLRGGNGCGATESGLFVIDISNISSPEMVASYPLDGPYGLGASGNQLFVCDGASGLKVYDKTDVLNLQQQAHFPDVVTYDVIPLANNLLMVGDGIIYQYRYLESGLELLSSLSLKN